MAYVSVKYKLHKLHLNTEGLVDYVDAVSRAIVQASARAFLEVTTNTDIVGGQVSGVPVWSGMSKAGFEALNDLLDDPIHITYKRYSKKSGRYKRQTRRKYTSYKEYKTVFGKTYVYERGTTPSVLRALGKSLSKAEFTMGPQYGFTFNNGVSYFRLNDYFATGIPTTKEAPWHLMSQGRVAAIKMMRHLMEHFFPNNKPEDFVYTSTLTAGRVSGVKGFKTQGSFRTRREPVSKAAIQHAVATEAANYDIQGGPNLPF